MSTSAMLWSSSPAMLGRPSSPLNPLAHPPSSSSPLSSPTPPSSNVASTSATLLRPGSSSQMYVANGRRPSQPVFHTRYQRPTGRRSQSASVSPQSPFGDGTSPIESSMWKERLERRVAERAKRKEARDQLFDRRRGTGQELADEEEFDRQAEADDEEVFRRLVIMQRRKAQQAQLQSLEKEAGGPGPMLQDFWEEDELDLEGEPDGWMRSMQGGQEDAQILSSPYYRQDEPRRTIHQTMDFSPYRPPVLANATPTGRSADIEEEWWAEEAAEAEEAERDAEEAEMARRVEEQYRQAQQNEMDID